MPIYGGNRRVPGLRREEVALLAGVSVDYYTRLERGNLSGVSDSVLESISRALHLDEAERAHRRPNRLGCALYCDLLTDAVQPANNATFVFLNPPSQDFFADWDSAANDIVAMLRSEAGRDPYDRALSDLVGESSTRSELSASDGRHTTCGFTARGSSICIIPWWATSTSPMKRCTCPPTPI